VGGGSAAGDDAGPDGAAGVGVAAVAEDPAGAGFGIGLGVGLGVGLAVEPVDGLEVALEAEPAIGLEGVTDGCPLSDSIVDTGAPHARRAQSATTAAIRRIATRGAMPPSTRISLSLPHGGPRGNGCAPR
jgi:hypothetical protein